MMNIAKEIYMTKKKAPTNPRMKVTLSMLEVYLTLFCNQGIVFSHPGLSFRCFPRQD